MDFLDLLCIIEAERKEGIAYAQLTSSQKAEKAKKESGKRIPTISQPKQPFVSSSDRERMARV